MICDVWLFVSIVNIYIYICNFVSRKIRISSSFYFITGNLQCINIITLRYNNNMRFF